MSVKEMGAKGGRCVHDPRIAANDRAPGSDPLRLTRALTQDLRASLHGLRLALDMMAGVLQGGEAGPVGRFLGMARTEAAQLDRLVEQLGLWIRLMGGDYKVHLQRLDLGASRHRSAGRRTPAEV
jgi:signal transduction histidine kinase